MDRKFEPSGEAISLPGGPLGGLGGGEIQREGVEALAQFFAA